MEIQITADEAEYYFGMPHRGSEWWYEAAAKELERKQFFALQWTPEELAEFGRLKAPPMFTVRDERASAATTFNRIIG